MADDGALCKTLFYDITQQAQVSEAIALVDALNCYKRIVHAMVSMIFQAFGVPMTANKSILGAIENMIFSSVQDLAILSPLQAGEFVLRHRGYAKATGLHQQDGQSSAYAS
jgi:hypothetical protein